MCWFNPAVQNALYVYACYLLYLDVNVHIMLVLLDVYFRELNA